MISGKRITKRQHQVLEFIRLMLAETGQAPTQQEIATALGLKSKNYVHVMLERLEDLGAIRREPYAARAIELVEG